MEWKWFSYFIVFLANIVPSEAKDLHSLRCLLENTFEPCIVFPDTSSHNVTVFSNKLIDEYANLSVDIHYAIQQQNLTLISEGNLEKIPDGLLLLLPANHLSSINRKYLTNLIIQRHKNSVVKHLVKAYLLGEGDEYLLEKLQTVDLPVRSLTWIANVISSDSHGAKEILNDPPLLFYSPPFSLLFNKTSEKLFYFTLWEKSTNISKQINKAYLRFWALATIKNSFPGSLSYWNDLCLERWGTLLTSSTADELRMLNHSNIDNLQLLFSFGFSTIQMRTILEEFGEQLMNSRFGYFTLSKLLIDLLPEQLLHFSKIVPYIEQFKVLPSIKSIATSKQIFELLVFKKETGDEKGYPFISNFSYVLPLKTLSDIIKQPISLPSLIKIQSDHFSKSQLYILSSRTEVFDFNSPYIFECRDLIKVLPARNIIFNKTTSHVLLHLLSVVAADNIPQSFSVFNKLWNMIGFSNVLKKILANRDSDTLLEYIPSRFIAKYADNIFTIIDENFNVQTKLPDSFVSSLLVSLSEAEKQFSLLNAKDSLTFLFNGISCDDISSLDPYDFVIFMSKFNEQRRISGKDFPKPLQQCSIEKFLAYIDLKFYLFQGILGESKLSLLNEAEIDSIGGYIFSALPIKPIEKAKYLKRIIKTIGELSLSELIMATTISKLQEFGTVLVHDDFIAGKKIDFLLYDLGNLTLFLDEKYISKLNKTHFQLLLESRYIDRRVCTNKSSRLAWFNFLKQCFGETSNWTYQTLSTLGDLLIVVPDEEVEKIPSDSWKYAADVLISHYNDIIKYSSSLKFYEACMLQLNSDEAQWFFNDLKHLVKVYTDAAQLQLNSVISFQELKKQNKSNDELFIFINSTKSKIKTPIPSTLDVINAEKPVMKNETQILITENPNKDGIKFSNSVSGNESSSTSRSLNDYSIDLKYLTETTVNNDCNYSTVYPNYVSEERAIHLDFTTETSLNENLYTTFNKSITTKEVNDRTVLISDSASSIFSSMTKVTTFSNVEKTTFFDVYEKYFNVTTPLDYVTYLNVSTPSDYVTYSNVTATSDYIKYLNLITSLDYINYPILSNFTTADIKNASLYENEFGNIRGYLTTKSLNHDVIQSSTYTFKNDVTTSTTVVSYDKNVYDFKSSGFKTDFNDSLSETLSLTTPINIISMNGRQTDITPRNSEELITYNSDHNPKISFTTSKPVIERIQIEIKDMEEKQFENLFKHNSKTQFLNLNFPSFKSKLGKISPFMIRNNTRGRVKRSKGQYSCEVLKMIGKLAEIVVSEELIENMSEEELNECVDLFSEMDLSLKVKELIWRKLKMDHIFLYGKLVSAINISDIVNMNFSLYSPWALEMINLIGRYSTDSEIKEHIIKRIIGTSKLNYTPEILVTLGSLVCKLPEISSRLIEPSDLLKASVILGRNLPCDYPCLQKLSNIAIKEGAFEDLTKWNSKDVSDLGIIIAGLERIRWKKLLRSKKKPLKGISEQAYKCLPREYVEELEMQYNMNFSKIYLKNEELFDNSVHFDFFGTSNNSNIASIEYISLSAQLNYFYFGFHLQMLFIALLMILNHL